MTRKLIRSPALYAGVPYSYAAIAPAGSTVFTAGACPIDSEGRVVAPGDVASQTRHTLNNLLAALRAAGCGLEDVVKTTVYVPSSERSDLLAAWEVVELLRQRRTAEHAPRGQRPRVRRPARTGRGGRRPRLSERQDARGSRSSALQSREVSRETRIGIVVAALAVSAMAVDHLIEDGGGVPADLGGFRVHRGLVAGASCSS